MHQPWDTCDDVIGLIRLLGSDRGQTALTPGDPQGRSVPDVADTVRHIYGLDK